jgi:hypothetical protein
MAHLVGASGKVTVIELDPSLAQRAEANLSVCANVCVLQGAPALADISMARASERFEPRLVTHFSNGHRASVTVRAYDFYRFLQRYLAWVLSDGRAIYAQIVQNRIAAREAHARGLRLLEENLSPAQRDQYKRCGYFDVVGGETGERYRIRHGFQRNVEQLDKKGRHVCRLCFMPEGKIVIGDVMLAQKLALELFESDTLKIANAFSPHLPPFGPMP